MALFLEITVVVLVVGLLAATALAMAVGLVGGLAGEVVERCRQCGRYGLTVRGQRHDGKCPRPLPVYVDGPGVSLGDE
jgi:hypothetical protein